MQAVKNTIAENFGGPSHKLAEEKFDLDDVPDLSGKVAVVTGGTEGNLLHFLRARQLPARLHLEVNYNIYNRYRLRRYPYPSLQRHFQAFRDFAPQGGRR